MKPKPSIILSTSPPAQTAEKPKGTLCLSCRRRFLYGGRRRKFTGKERDSETGLYYFGARYMDSKTSRWLSGDPAMGEYVPQAGKGGGGLPGMGSVFNYVNLHAYHYAGNNPVKYTDPDGRNSIWEIDESNKTIEIKIPVNFSEGTTDEQKRDFITAAEEWGGTYRLPSGFSRHDGMGRKGENDYKIRFTVIETSDNVYEGIEVNKITFSPESYSEEENRIPNVRGSKDMTIYRNYGSSPGDRVNLLKHEIAHLLGIGDRYYSVYDENGVRTGSFSMPGSENNIAAQINGQVSRSNFFEANNRTYVNKKVFK